MGPFNPFHLLMDIDSDDTDEDDAAEDGSDPKAVTLRLHLVLFLPLDLAEQFINQPD